MAWPLNDNGNLNMVTIKSVSDTTIIGQPFSHLKVAHRHNLTVVTPNRAVGTRGGVLVKSTDPDRRSARSHLPN